MTSLDVTAQQLEQAVAEAEVRRLTRPAELRAMLERNRGRAGVRALRAVIESDAPPAFTRSEAETRMLNLIRKAGLPAPAVNVRLANREVDFLWRRERLVLEIDGFRFHSTRRAFEDDRWRDAKLQALGFRVIRVTWRRLLNEPVAVMARVARLLGSGPQRPAEEPG